MVYGNRRSNYVLRNHASSPIGLSAISSTHPSIRLMRSIVRFQRLLPNLLPAQARPVSRAGNIL